MGGPKKKSCGTCRDRRILCDRGIPVCSQCTRAKRACKGYGLRLSWPKENDAKRAIASKSSQNTFKVRKYRGGDAVMVRRSHWDIEMHMHLSSLVSHAPLLHTPVSWNPHGMGELEWNLMSYFENETSRSLTMFGSDTTALGKMLMRFSQSEKTLGSLAVLHALLGLASLDRYGYNEQAMELKISSLRALGKGLGVCDAALERVYHIAAGMLLCSIEVHQASCSASEWTWYLKGIKKVILCETTKGECVVNDNEKAMLVNWVYYHDVMKQFSIRHWGKGPLRPRETAALSPQLHREPGNVNLAVLPHCWPIQDLTLNETHSSTDEVTSEDILMYHSNPPGSISWVTVTIKLMSEICDTVPTKPSFATMNPKDSALYHNQIKILDWRIRNIPLPSPDEQSPYPHSVVHLYKLAMLIYLNRVTEDMLGQREKVQGYIDEAFSLLSKMHSCKPHFPMYIVGWEARTDEQRATWLEMLERTKKSRSARSVFHVETLVQAGWAQDDLAEEGLDYWDKVTALVRCCSTMPSFV